MESASIRTNAEYGELSYKYPVERLWSGGSYGNVGCFARTDRLSNLDGLWHAGSNDWLCGRLDLSLEAGGHGLKEIETYFHPGHQVTISGGEGVTAEKTVFVPYGNPDGSNHGCSFYTVLRLRAAQSVEVYITCDVRWPATASRSQTKQPERQHMQRRVRQWLEGSTLWAETVPFRVDSWNTWLGDGGEVRALLGPEGAEATFSEPGRAHLVYSFSMEAGEETILPFVLLAGTAGINDLRERSHTLPGWDEALTSTVAAYEEVLGRALLVTPDVRINRGLQWAKANTVRVQHRYRQGAGFTNDPPQDIVVVRDCAWYGLGADWLTPDFTEAMYDLILDHGVHDGGKITEYIHADTGRHEDYALNINDDTPLFVIGALHHYAASGSDDFLRRVYPAVRNACDWILAQRRDGLVWCTVEGADMWGNATWRNIIPGYNLAGAVTEINALCHMALNAAANLARAANEERDADRWLAAAGELRTAINIQLITEDGLYVLNRGENGVNTTRTGDLVFPILGEVADTESARHILDLLYSPLFCAPYGIRTVARDEAEYHPAFGYGLMGGLWPNLTAWVAYAGRLLHPDRLAQMMSAIYALSEADNPLAGGHLVPGEFPEWLDGETLESLGMAMSPWMPPTYLWVGVEGLAGVAATTHELAVTPNLPAHWSWLIMRDLPYRGGRLSFFVHEGRLHTTHAVQSTLPQSVYNRDVTAEVEVTGTIKVSALEDETATAILVCAPEEVGGATDASIQGMIRFRGHTQTVSLAPGQAILTRWDNRH